MQKEPFLLVLDNFHKLGEESRTEMGKTLSGETYSQCSVMAASKHSHQDRGNLYTETLKLEGWKEEVVMEVIHRQFSHSPNKVLALKLKLTSNDPYHRVLRCPLLVGLACLAYEDTGELPVTGSETLHNIMRCVFRRELYQSGRTLHDQNYDTILTTLGHKCLYNIIRGRTYLRSEDVVGVARKYCHTVMGFLVPTQQLGHNNKKDKKTYFEPLHRSFLEFAAAFYLKSLSEKNNQDQLGVEMVEMFENNTECIETILNFALEMLAADNAGSDILTRIPRHHHRLVSRSRVVNIGDTAVNVSSDQEVRGCLDQAARLRLLYTAGYTAQNLGSVLLGLMGHQPLVGCSVPEIVGWSRLLEYRPDMFTSLSLVWSASTHAPMPQLNLGRLFEVISRSSITSLDITLDCGDGEHEPCDQMRYTGQLLDAVATTLHELKLTITDGVTVFPIIESLSQLVKTADSLTSLTLDLELSPNNLSLITSSLHKCKSIHTLKLLKAASGSAGLKHLQALIKSGRLHHLEYVGMPIKLFQVYNDDTDAVSGEYVYEDEALICEETKLARVTPLLQKVVEAAGLQDKDLSPVEIVDGCLHPCLRYSNVYPSPVCCNHKSGCHSICQSLSSPHTRLTTLNMVISDSRDLLCLGDCLTTNTSLKNLTISTKVSSKPDSQIPKSTTVSFAFPLLFGVSCHIGLTDLNLSGMKMKMDSESLELILAAFSSNTALSLKMVSNFHFVLFTNFPFSGEYFWLEI